MDEYYIYFQVLETDDEYIVFKRLVICYEKVGKREKAEEYIKKIEELEEKD